MLPAKPVQFVVPLSMQECKARIVTMDDESFLGSTRVQLSQGDKRTTEYEIKIWRFLNFLGSVSGGITHKGNQLTQVTTTTQLAVYLKLFLIVYTVLAILLTLNDLSNNRLPLGIIFVPWGVMLWLWWGWLCNRVANELIERLRR